jgi:uncharacterized protein (DUF488 family)
MNLRVSQVMSIGVYGWTTDRFFEALAAAGVDLVVDVRARRGVRGSACSFANHRRLEARLAEEGIGYLYVPELAPGRQLRTVQVESDARRRLLKRQRDKLASAFAERYRSEVLAAVPIMAICERIASAGSAPVLLCVERVPEACHRSLAAAAVAGGLGASVRHLVP